MGPVLQCLTPPQHIPAHPPASLPGLVPLFSQPNAASARWANCQATPPSPPPHLHLPPHCCSEYSAAVSCISLIRSPHTHIKADRLLLLSCYTFAIFAFFVPLCLAFCTMIYDLCSHCLVFNNLPFFVFLTLHENINNIFTNNLLIIFSINRLVDEMS